MNKFKEIEKLLSEWKADMQEAERTEDNHDMNMCGGAIAALESALTILKRPSNQAIATDTKPCYSCKTVTKFNWYPFCKWCGRALPR